MSNDRELLELAAEAAGIKVKDYYEDEDTLAIKPGPGRPTARWNPLTDDGDALRLAVKLCMVVNVCGHFTFACSSDADVEELHNGDPYAATRRAIVRAAAEIGRNL